MFTRNIFPTQFVCDNHCLFHETVFVWAMCEIVSMDYSRNYHWVSKGIVIFCKISSRVCFVLFCCAYVIGSKWIHVINWIILVRVPVCIIALGVPMKYNPDMMTSSNGNIFHATGLLWGESTGHRWIPLTKTSDAELWCFFLSVPERTVE